MQALLLRLCHSLGLVAALGCAPTVSTPSIGNARIRGVVENLQTHEPMENALVVLQCSCLENLQEERFTNKRGIYSFDDLPPGNYTIQVLAGEANVAKTIELRQGTKSRTDFAINPMRNVDTVIVEPCLGY